MRFFRSKFWCRELKASSVDKSSKKQGKTIPNGETREGEEVADKFLTCNAWHRNEGNTSIPTRPTQMVLSIGQASMLRFKIKSFKLQ